MTTLTPMMKNDSLEKIGKRLTEAQTVLLFPHVRGDGDAFGSCAALCHALRGLGKDCWILMEDKVPDVYEFLVDGMVTWDQDILGIPDVCMCVDCGEENRLPKRLERFRSGRTTICLDHHEAPAYMCDFNYVEPDAAATGELVYMLLVAMGVEPDRECAEDLYAAITKDTGNFEYGNTTARTHRIVASLYDTGANLHTVGTRLNENEKLSKIRLLGRALNSLELTEAGLFAMVCVTRKMMEDCGAREEDTDGIVETIRGIAGVEMAAVLKESDDGTVRVSMRVKNLGNVAAICRQFGGGGHEKAAGFTWHGSIEDAKDAVRDAAKADLEKYVVRNH